MSNLLNCSEKELLLKVAEGNEDSFRQLFSKYHQILGRYVYGMTDSMNMAEEIVHDVFFKIWINRKTLTGIHNFKAYLFVVSKNHTLNSLRKLSYERLSIINCEAVFKRERLYEEDSNIYHTLLDEAIDHSPLQQRKVYLLSRHERLRYAEVAIRLNISRETVKKYLQIATASITTYVQSKFKTAVSICFVSLFF